MTRNGLLAEIDMTLHRGPESCRETNHIAAATSRRMSQFTHEPPSSAQHRASGLAYEAPGGLHATGTGPARAAPQHAL